MIIPPAIWHFYVLTLKSVDRNKVIEEAINFEIDKEDAELLSYFYNDGELIYDFINNEEESENYFEAKSALKGLLDWMENGNYRDVIYYNQKEIIPLIKSKEELRFFVDLLSEVFEDILNIKSNRQIHLTSYDTILQNLANKLPHIEDSLIEILKARNVVNLNVNISLLLDHLIIKIIKE